jgi:hypothetical protein
MNDVLITDVPDGVLAAIDARALRLASRGRSTSGGDWAKTPRSQP